MGFFSILKRLALPLLVLVLLLIFNVLRRQRFFREALLKRPAAVRASGRSSPQLGVLATIKNEAMGLREWLAHYSWQGVDAIVLLDNGSTETYDDILADFPFATLFSAPERYAQALNYGEIGRPWFEERGIDFVAVLDIDEFFWSEERGSTFKDLVVRAFSDESASQFTCPFYHFGSNGYDRQPQSVRECLTKRSAVTSDVVHGKSVVRLRDLVQFNIHAHEVNGVTIPCPPALLNFHYKAQSREYWARVKMNRGDAYTESANGARTWAQFDIDDRTGSAIRDNRLRDALRSAGSTNATCPTHTF